MSVGDWKDFATVVGVIIAGITLIKALIEYTRGNVDKRAKQFIDLRSGFRANAEFQAIVE